MVGIDGDVIDPAPMAVMADQNGCSDRLSGSADQDRGIRSASRQCDIGGGIVPRPRQSAALPQRYYGADVRIPDRGNGKRGFRNRRRCVHSTLPGFMMPKGSSITLMPRISSIATFSFTSGN